MIRRAAAISALLLLPCFCSAATYRCAVKQRSAAGEKKDLWSGKIVLKGVTDVAVLIIGKDGAGISIEDLSEKAGGVEAIRRALKPYDGLPVIGLRRQKAGLDVNLGHVDSTNEKDFAPMDADGWASAETKEIGVTDVRRGLTALCRLE